MSDDSNFQYLLDAALSIGGIIGGFIMSLLGRTIKKQDDEIDKKASKESVDNLNHNIGEFRDEMRQAVREIMNRMWEARKDQSTRDERNDRFPHDR